MANTVTNVPKGSDTFLGFWVVGRCEQARSLSHNLALRATEKSHIPSFPFSDATEQENSFLKYVHLN